MNLTSLLIALVAGGLAFALARRVTWMRAMPIVWADRLMFIGIAVYAIFFSTLAIVRYLGFRTGYLGVFTSWDLGLFNQAIWNSLHGRIMENSFIPDAPSYLGKSFSPLLIAFVPFYAIWSNPIVLLVVQASGLALVALPLYWHARKTLGAGLALVVGLAYLLFPGVQHITQNEFHDIALEAPLLAFALFFLLRRRYVPFLICLALGWLAKEEVAVITIGFGAYIFLVQRQWKLGLTLAFVGVCGAAILLQYVIPALRGSQFGAEFYYFGSGQTGGGGVRYAYLGRSVPEIALTILTRPDVILDHLADPTKLQFLADLLVPLSLLPLIGFEIAALALPTLAYSLLSTYPLQYSIKFYYFAPYLPFLFFALVLGLQRLTQRNAREWRFALGTMVLTTSVLAFATLSPAPLGGSFQPERYVLDEHAALGRELITAIPSDAVVIAQNEFLAALSNRQHVYEPPMIPDYRQADYVFGDSTREWYAVHRAGWEAYARDGFFVPIVERDGYWVGRPRDPDHLVHIRFGALELLGYSIVPTGTLRGKMDLRPVLAWRAVEPVEQSLQIALRVVDVRGHVWASDEREPLDGKSPTNTWRVNKVVNDQYTLRLPPTMPAGDYTILVQVRDQELELARIHIEKNKSSFTASELYIEQPLQIDMREMRLLGFVPPRATIAPGEWLQLGLYWRARAKPQGDYLVAVQLRDTSGQIMFVHTSRPANDTYPTTGWDAGEVLLDWHDFDLPADLKPGEYQIFVALRERETNLGETRIAPLTVVK